MDTHLIFSCHNGITKSLVLNEANALIEDMALTPKTKSVARIFCEIIFANYFFTKPENTRYFSLFVRIITMCLNVKLLLFFTLIVINNK